MSTTPITYIGPYRLINIVYTGQCSQTWQAYDDRNRRPVAIKVLFQSAAKKRDQIAFFKWEYNVGKELNNDRLIKFYSTGKYGYAPYIAMEWFAAPNVKQYMQRGYDKYCVDLPLFIPQMAEALMCFHEAGWVHCDIKPDNFLCHSERGIKLIDFALARKIKPGFFEKFFNMKKQPQGTASYMSPEQIRGLPLDGRSDIYSLGCTWYEMLANRNIYTGISMNELLQKHLSSPAPSITARNQNVTPEFSELLMKMLAKRPKDRIQTASDLCAAVNKVRIFRRNPQAGDKVH
ncbi:MAG: serine/threonine-protein kinase [Planctomycetia bacterium]|nr:serine/threonine-protein kinase [Planctomycetia bacterium]